MRPLGGPGGAGGIVTAIGATALGAAAAAVAVALGRLVFPLDDAWIYLQYARAALDGAPFSYDPDEPASTGATSLLWLLLVTLARAATAPFSPPGGDGAFFSAVYMLHGAIAVATFLLAARLATRAGAARESALVPAALCVLAPAWCLGWFNGMETGLYGAALLAGALALRGGSPAWLAPLALARPEGAVLAVALLGVIVLGNRGAQRSREWRLAAIGVVVLVAAAALWPWLLTGHPSAGWTAKAQWTEPDPEARSAFLSRLPGLAARALGFGLCGARAWPGPGRAAEVLANPAAWAWLVFLAGGAALALRRAGSRGPVLLWAGASLLVLGATAWDAQFHRYLVASFPLLLAGAVAGWFGGGGGTRAPGAVAVIAVVAAALVGPAAAPRRAVWLLRGEAERMRLTQIGVGAWIDANLPRGARVATHDVGAIAWYGGRPVTDLVGLVTPETASAYRHGEGAMWEALRALPPDRGPTHAAVVPAWMPQLYRTLWFEERLHPVEGKRDASSRRFEVWRLAPPDSLSDAPAGHGPLAGQPGLDVVDAVDVADLDSERRHGYAYSVAGDPLDRAKPTFARDLELVPREPGGRMRHAVEGGRILAGPERFHLVVDPDRPVVLVARASAPVYRRLVVRVGDWSDVMAIEAGEGIGREPAVVIPAESVRAARDRAGRIVVEADVEGGGPGVTRRAFHWWALQPVDASRTGPASRPGP